MFALLSALAAGLFATTSFSAPTTSVSAAPSNYSLVADFSGNNFFSGFTAFTGADPTNGNVAYVGMDYAAERSYLGYIDNQVTNSTNAYIGVDYSNVTADRNSVRLSSKQTFSAGTIMTLDVVHAPVAYGTWPAVWMLGGLPGGTWPNTNGGEIDALEWVHETNYNSMTLHTGECTVDNSSSAFQGQLQNTNCNAGSGSTGCSIEALSQDNTNGATLATAGKAFNDQGGAVYAVVWTAQGVSVYIFPRDNQPSDLASGSPDPASWNTVPLAQFSGSGCDFTKALSDMTIVIDTTFCGDWAGKVWTSSGAAAATGVATCAAYVQNNPQAFKDAYFEIASIKMYSSSDTPPGTATTAKRDVSAPADFPTINIGDRHDSDNSTSGMNSTEHRHDHAHHANHHQHHHPNGTHGHTNTSAPCNSTNTATHSPSSTASLPSAADKDTTFGSGSSFGGGYGSGESSSSGGQADPYSNGIGTGTLSGGANTDFEASAWAVAALFALVVAAILW